MLWVLFDIWRNGSEALWQAALGPRVPRLVIYRGLEHAEQGTGMLQLFIGCILDGWVDDGFARVAFGEVALASRLKWLDDYCSSIIKQLWSPCACTLLCTMADPVMGAALVDAFLDVPGAILIRGLAACSQGVNLAECLPPLCAESVLDLQTAGAQTLDGIAAG